jgi:hypothetical protein
MSETTENIPEKSNYDLWVKMGKPSFSGAQTEEQNLEKFEALLGRQSEVPVNPYKQLIEAGLRDRQVAEQLNPGSSHWEGNTLVTEKPIREVVQIVQSLTSHLQPPSQPEWDRVLDELATLGVDGFSAKYYALYSNPGMNQLEAREKWNTAMKMVTNQIRADTRRYEDMKKHERETTVKKCLQFTEGGFFALECGHDNQSVYIQKELARANGNPISCRLCDKGSDYQKVKRAFYAQANVGLVN